MPQQYVLFTKVPHIKLYLKKNAAFLLYLLYEIYICKYIYFLATENQLSVLKRCAYNEKTKQNSSSLNTTITVMQYVLFARSQQVKEITIMFVKVLFCIFVDDFKSFLLKLYILCDIASHLFMEKLLFGHSIYPHLHLDSACVTPATLKCFMSPLLFFLIGDMFCYSCMKCLLYSIQ